MRMRMHMHMHMRMDMDMHMKMNMMRMRMHIWGDEYRSGAGNARAGQEYDLARGHVATSIRCFSGLRLGRVPRAGLKRWKDHLSLGAHALDRLTQLSCGPSESALTHSRSAA